MGQLSNGIEIPGVFEKHGAYYKIISNRWHRLCRIDEGTNALYRALYELDPQRPGTYSDLLKTFVAAGLDGFKPATRKDYTNIALRLQHTFGHMPLGSLESDHIAQWLEKRRKAGKGATRANREFTVLSTLHVFGMRNGWVKVNPCIGVRRNKEKPHRRYVTDQEFLEAFNRSNEPFQDLLAVAYLTGIRQTDLVNMKRAEHVQKLGLQFVESKTGKPHHQEWSRAVAFFVQRSIDREPSSEYVLTNTRGEPWGIWAINSQMTRLKVDWAFKDLRAKAQTDAKHGVLGHALAMESRYRKILHTARPLGPQWINLRHCAKILDEK